MKKKRLIPCLLAFFIVFSSNKVIQSPEKRSVKSFALVELFTSEGCSSCPPADEAVGKINTTDKNIYVLSFHVDYWNSLGWKDIYSDPAYSERQQTYGTYFQLSSIYTPQIIVNGKTQFVGSDEQRLQKAIESSMQEVPAAEVSLSVHPANQNQIAVSCSVSDARGKILHVALVQHRATDFIQRGENKGRTLNHFYIVRDFKTEAADKSQEILYLRIPSGVPAADCDVIAFLQDGKTGWIQAASRFSLKDLATLKA